jgi:hypothetical protein
MKRTFGLGLLVLGLFAVGCGGGGGDDGGGPPTGPGPGGGSGNTFTATIDGTAWKSDTNLISVTGNNPATRQGTLVITGFQTSSMRAVSLFISFIIGPATQPLGVNQGTTPGGTASVIVGTDSWLTPMSGKAGTIKITARTDKRIAGEFNFAADGLLPGMIPPARTVTNGKFDITIDAGLPPLPTGVGSTAIATIGGTPWNAATIVGLHPGPGSFSIALDNTSYSISITPKVVVSAGNAYGIPSQINFQILETGTSNSWAAITGPDIGTFALTTLDANRMIANFSVTGLPALSGGGAPLTIIGGAINAHLEN